MPVPGHIHGAHALVSQYHQSPFFQVDRRQVGAVPVPGSLALLDGLDPVVSPVPEVHVSQRQPVVGPLLQLVVLWLGAHEDGFQPLAP